MHRTRTGGTTARRRSSSSTRTRLPGRPGSDPMPSRRDTGRPQNCVFAFPPDATGGRFFTVTVSRYSLVPPSRSRILAPTGNAPLSVVRHDADVAAPNVAVAVAAIERVAEPRGRIRRRRIGDAADAQREGRSLVCRSGRERPRRRDVVHRDVPRHRRGVSVTVGDLHRDGDRRGAVADGHDAVEPEPVTVAPVALHAYVTGSPSGSDADTETGTVDASCTVPIGDRLASGGSFSATAPTAIERETPPVLPEGRRRSGRGRGFRTTRRAAAATRIRPARPRDGRDGFAGADAAVAVHVEARHHAVDADVVTGGEGRGYRVADGVLLPSRGWLTVMLGGARSGSPPFWRR